THSIEAMMQDGRALQAGTSHFLGQNFSRAANIRFQDSNGETQFAYTTSWGASTRLVGAMIMTHGDDDGLRLPPRLAPYPVVILPIVRDPAAADSVISAARALSAQLANRHLPTSRFVRTWTCGRRVSPASAGSGSRKGSR